MVRWSSQLAALAALATTATSKLLTVPSTPYDAQPGHYSLQKLKNIVIDSRHAKSVNTEGLTLIPPTLEQFTNTFKSDIQSALGLDLTIVNGEEAAPNSIFITLDSSTKFQDVAGRNTSEGYKLSVKNDGITIAGASPLGAWWGTRSVLQAAVLNKNTIPYGQGVDAPGWANRGFMLDTGRHFYPPEFFIEMCSYVSFFKQNTIQIHLSDNINNYPDRYTHDRTFSLYGSFRPWSDDPAVAGLNTRKNESFTRDEFDLIQQKCAQRGVTIIPEIEAPGHALEIVKWKPELGLADLSMLNISHPDTIPTMKKIWSTFLPWFHSKVVHIGADEYDKKLVADYTRFVNEMAAHIKKESGKSMRIWGTFTPKQGANISKEITIQHWSNPSDNAWNDLIKNGYKVLNSEKAFYHVSKYYAVGEPPWKHNAFYGNPAGGAFSPNIFDVKNASNNPPRDTPNVQGHLAAVWNDWGPNGTTYLETYYAVRDALPALGDKQWGGELTEVEYDGIIDDLRDAIPAQNLDRKVKSKTDVILDYRFTSCRSKPTSVKDISGNKYHGKIQGQGCKIANGTLSLSGNCYVETPLRSKGRNYTLSFSVKPHESNRHAKLLSGPDSILLADEPVSGNVSMLSGGQYYTLNYTLPVNMWSNVSVIAKGNQTFFEISSADDSGKRRMEFLTKLGIWGLRFVWGPMAFEAPLERIGEGFVGELRDVKLLGSAS